MTRPAQAPRTKSPPLEGSSVNRYEIYASAIVGKFNWRLVAANNKIVHQSTQGFESVRDARRAIRRARWLAIFSRVVVIG